MVPGFPTKMIATLAMAFAPSLLPAPNGPWNEGEKPGVFVEQVQQEQGGSYLALRVEGLDFTPWKAVAGPGGELYLAGTARVSERGSTRRGFGVLKLDADGRPAEGFGRKLGGRKIGLAFVPVLDDLEPGALVGACLQPSAKAGREKLVLVANAELTETSGACMVLARVALRDGKPKRLAGKMTLAIGFGEGLEGRSFARGLFASENGITVVGDRDGNPAFLRLDPGDGELDSGFGAPVEPGEDGSRSGKLVIPIDRFANLTYAFTTAVDTFTCQPAGDIFAVGHVIDEDLENKAFQTLFWVTADGRPMPGFGIDKAHGGATTLYYELPGSGKVPVELSMHSVLHIDAPEGKQPPTLFVGLGSFRTPGRPPLCALNLWRLVPATDGLSGRRSWTLESQIFSVDAHEIDPAQTGLRPQALLKQRDGELLVVVSDEQGRMLASHHDVRHEYDPAEVRDFSPWYDGRIRDDLLHGVPPSQEATRVLFALQVDGEKEYLVLARIAAGQPTILRRFDTATGDPDVGW